MSYLRGPLTFVAADEPIASRLRHAVEIARAAGMPERLLVGRGVIRRFLADLGFNPPDGPDEKTIIRWRKHGCPISRAAGVAGRCVSTNLMLLGWLSLVARNGHGARAPMAVPPPPEQRARRILKRARRAAARLQE
jgi:hypothetical protein